jgi:hypothetical protein
MGYKKFECDFIRRTLKIIEQYEAHVEKNSTINEKYEVTLLINCLLGLLVLPDQRLLVDKIPDIPFEKFEEWGLPKNFVTNWGNIPESERNLKKIIHHMRNSIAHFRVTPFGNSFEITSIKFRDCDSSGRTTFEGEIPVKCLKIFVKKLAHTILLECCKS